MKKESVLGVVRHTLTFVGGILIAKGLIDEGVLSEIIGGVITLAGGLWSVIDKAKKVSA
jgi:hypothetical protein